MYKFFSELNAPNDFKIYLTNYNTSQKYLLRNITLSPDFFKKYEILFKRLNVVEQFVMGTQQDLSTSSFKLSYEEWENEGMFFCHKQDNDWRIKYMKEKIDASLYDISDLLEDYRLYCAALVGMYPDYAQFLSSTKVMIDSALAEIHRKNSIQLPPESEGVECRFPNAFYITPNGYLYNTGGEHGHKEGNLIYPYRHIFESLNRNFGIPHMNSYDDIQEILRRGYVTQNQFKTYSNFMYSMRTIDTPELDHVKKQWELFYSMSEEEREKATARPLDVDRSYQKNIITLVIGYLSAKDSLYQSFQVLNDSNRQREIAYRLSTITKGNFADMLVRYCGFHKVESVVERVITTSSLTSIEKFESYLENGWQLHVIPGIVYDKTKDEIAEMDFESCYISPFLEEKVEKYKGKVKVFNSRKSN